MGVCQYTNIKRCKQFKLERADKIKCNQYANEIIRQKTLIPLISLFSNAITSIKKVSLRWIYFKYVQTFIHD